MAQSQLPVARPEHYCTAITAALIGCRLVSGEAEVPSDPCDVSVASRGLGRRAATGAPDRVPGRAGADAYEITVTLRVRSDDLEDVVARSFADPYCVDVRVQSTTRLRCGDVEVGCLQSDDQASQRVASRERARWQAFSGGEP